MKKSQSKQNRRRKGILLAIIMILFTGVVLTASTYAWFTANRSVTVESIDVNVQATEGLQISTDATEWKAVITNDDITTASWTGVINQLPKGTGVYASPVSTIGQTDTNGLMQMYKGTVATPEGQSALKGPPALDPCPFKSSGGLSFVPCRRLRNGRGPQIPE